MDSLPGFDPATMTYLATQMAQPNMGNSLDSFQDMMLPVDMRDPQSTYGFVG